MPADDGAVRARTANLLGALALEAAQAQERATRAVVGQTGAAAAALVMIAARPGRTVEQLRGPLGLSQPGATRLLERLVGEGWVERGGAGGRRGLSIHLTPAGRRVLDDLLAARQAALTRLLEPLAPTDLDGLAGHLETLLAARTGGLADLDRLCRLCERRACAECPVAAAVR